MTQDTSPGPDTPPDGPPSAAASAGLTLFVETLQQAGLLEALGDDWLEGYAPRPGETREASRRLDLLAAWYGAGLDGPHAVDGAAVPKRIDRFFLHRTGDPADAAELVGRLGRLAPELPAVALERLGSPDGPLVLRAGGSVAPVLDDETSGFDTNEIDLSEVEDAPETVSVRSLVAALNTLLAKAGAADRLVALHADATREAYVGVRREEAHALLEAGLLDDTDADAVDELASWG